MARNISACLAGAALLAVTAPLSAHHAVTAEFDQNKPITFKGTIKVVEWANPHIYTQVEVKEADGKTVVYRVEGAAPNSLFRQGWRPDTLEARRRGDGQRHSLQERDVDEHRPGDHHDGRRQEARRSRGGPRRGAAAAAVADRRIARGGAAATGSAVRSDPSNHRCARASRDRTAGT